MLYWTGLTVHGILFSGVGWLSPEKGGGILAYSVRETTVVLIRLIQIYIILGSRRFWAQPGYLVYLLPGRP